MLNVSAPSVPLSASVAAAVATLVPTATFSFMSYGVVVLVQAGVNVDHAGSYSFTGVT